VVVVVVVAVEVDARVVRTVAPQRPHVARHCPRTVSAKLRSPTFWSQKAFAFWHDAVGAMSEHPATAVVVTVVAIVVVAVVVVAVVAVVVVSVAVVVLVEAVPGWQSPHVRGQLARTVSPMLTPAASTKLRLQRTLAWSHDASVTTSKQPPVVLVAVVVDVVVAVAVAPAEQAPHVAGHASLTGVENRLVSQPKFKIIV